MNMWQQWQVPSLKIKQKGANSRDQFPGEGCFTTERRPLWVKTYHVPKSKRTLHSPYKTNKQNVLNWDSVFSLIIPSSHHTFPLWNPQHTKHRGSQRMWLPSQPLLVWIFPLGQQFPVCDVTGIRARFSLNVKTLQGHYKNFSVFESTYREHTRHVVSHNRKFKTGTNIHTNLNSLWDSQWEVV